VVIVYFPVKSDSSLGGIAQPVLSAVAIPVCAVANLLQHYLDIDIPLALSLSCTHLSRPPTTNTKQQTKTTHNMASVEQVDSQVNDEIGYIRFRYMY
jgi:hypothetical protein